MQWDLVSRNSNESSEYDDYYEITLTELSVTWYQLLICSGALKVKKFLITINP